MFLHLYFCIFHCVACVPLHSNTRKSCEIRQLFSLQVASLKEIITAQRKCQVTNATSLKNEIAHLPDAQQENIMACLNAAKHYRGEGNRYTTQWVYHCLLLKIRSNKAYEYLRRNKIMALPSYNTLYRYIKKLRPSYGFQTQIFEIMKEKAALMKPFETRGTYVFSYFYMSVCN